MDHDTTETPAMTLSPYVSVNALVPTVTYKAFHVHPQLLSWPISNPLADSLFFHTGGLFLPRHCTEENILP